MQFSFKKYKHTESSPMVINIFPMLMLQKDPKGSKTAKRPKPPLLIFLGWLNLELKIEV